MCYFEPQRMLCEDGFRLFSRFCVLALFSPKSISFSSEWTSTPRDKARVVLHNSMEASSNEFGKGLGSVCRSHRKGRDLSLKQSLELPAHSNSPAVNLSVSFTFTHWRKRIKGATISRAGILPQGGIYAYSLAPSLFSKWLQVLNTRSFSLNLPLSSES